MTERASAGGGGRIPTSEAAEEVTQAWEYRPPSAGRWLSSMKRRGGERTRAKLAGGTVRIWSGEHRAWWRPGRSGYTTLVSGAGVYTFEAAWDAAGRCGREKKIFFEIVNFGKEKRG